MKKDRGKVWLGTSAVVENDHGEWLVVMKSYSGLKDRWSLPAGFVNEGETVDEGVVREVKEETGIDCIVHGIIGFRTGVIREEISDNMAIFYCHMTESTQEIVIQENEIREARWIHPKDLAVDKRSSVMLVEIAKNHIEHYILNKIEGIDPGDIFGYTKYNLFFKK